jgi:hypothetical protein
MMTDVARSCVSSAAAFGPRRLRRAAAVGLWLALAASLGACGPQVRPCDDWCRYRRDKLDACDRGDGAACEASASFAFDRDKLLERGCRLGSGSACAKAAANIVDLHSPKPPAVERALELLRIGCRARDGASCRLGVRVLLAADRAAEVRGLVAQPCAAGETVSCRELGKSLAFGLGGEPDAPRGARLLEDACARDDAEACILHAFLLAAGRGVPKDPDRARTALDAMCAKRVAAGCTLAKALGEPRDGETAGVVLARAPAVVEYVGASAPPRYARVTLGVGGPFQIGRVSIGWIGTVAGAARETGAGRVVFDAARFGVVDMLWLPGDLVHLSWTADKRLTAEECAKGYDCRREAYCTFRDATCVRASASDCGASELCRDSGRCAFDDGECVATAEGCAASRYCRTLKLCRPHASGRYCVAGP